MLARLLPPKAEIQLVVGKKPLPQSYQVPWYQVYRYMYSSSGPSANSVGMRQATMPALQRQPALLRTVTQIVNRISAE